MTDILHRVGIKSSLDATYKALATRDGVQTSADPATGVATPLSDAQIFDAIKHGIPATVMPAHQSKLSDDQIWKITAYVKGLRGTAIDAPSPVNVSPTTTSAANLPLEKGPGISNAGRQSLVRQTRSTC